jgi:DNA recombination protein RmuC
MVAAMPLNILRKQPTDPSQSHVLRLVTLIYRASNEPGRTLMNITLISLLSAAAAANVGLLVALLLRSSSNRNFAKDVREDLRVGREELLSSNKEAHDTVADGIRTFTEMGVTLGSRVKELQDGSEAKLDATRGVLDRIRDTVDGKLDTVREELATGLKTHSDALVTSLDRTGTTQVERLDAMTKQVKEVADGNQSALERIRSTFDTRVDELRQSLGAQVKEMQESNERKLEEMRQTVDEKLQGTLEKRLGESFKFVSDRLEMVHKGLGEIKGSRRGSAISSESSRTSRCGAPGRRCSSGESLSRC